MIYRSLQDHLCYGWIRNPDGRPMILTGVTQAGKTSLVSQLMQGRRASLYLDMRIESDRRDLMSAGVIPGGIRGLFFARNKPFIPSQALLAADHLHLAPELLRVLVQLASQESALPVMGITSRLNGSGPETLSCILRPLSFNEFLVALDDRDALDSFAEVPFPVSGFHKLLHLFHVFALIGGMPSVVESYIRDGSLAGLDKQYDRILEAFYEQLDLAVHTQRQRDMIRMALLNAFPFASSRIRFRNFGNAPYGSRDTGEAFRRMEQLMILQLVYPTLSAATGSPAEKTRSPRVQLVDTGLVNRASGIQKNLLGAPDLVSLFRGQVLRHMVGQELLSMETDPSSRLRFWTRSKLQSSAETDYLLSIDGREIPLMVRSGEPGRLRSLHQFLDESPHPYAVRLHAGNVSVRKAETLSGKPFYLLNLPYFLAGRITEHLRGFIKYIEG